jgi:hypothetical protein
MQENEIKFRNLKSKNEKIKKYILDQKKVVELLKFLGFVKKKEDMEYKKGFLSERYLEIIIYEFNYIVNYQFLKK